MAPNGDQPGKSGTLPPAELNPLLNPVLNKHLGRWAEVYFTNPPERRDEAVLHLLRELESGGTGANAAPLVQARSEFHRPRIVSNQGRIVTCGGCGFENEAGQRFCGECGAPLAAIANRVEDAKPPEREPYLTRAEPVGPAPQFGSFLHLSDLTIPGRDESIDNRSQNATRFPALEEQQEAAPLRRSYRVSIGVALALLVASLAYMAWRGGQSAPGKSAFPAQAPPAAVNSASAQVPTTERQSPTLPPAPAVAANLKVENKQPSPPPANSTPATPNDAATSSANGNAELAQALRFLNGKERDTSQAAAWLWKAVEKQNTHATLLLAGLYLHGDGVQKSCDQGRILLDAAADKGNKEAADLLRNLQAFGCE